MRLAQLLLALGAVAGGLGVVFGAFGAHALKARLTVAALDTWQTAVLYQFVHAVGLLAVGLWLKLAVADGLPADRALSFAGIAFAVGILLFSGSLYALALGGPRWLGPVTPIGGLAFIAGWLALVFAALRP